MRVASSIIHSSRFQSIPFSISVVKMMLRHKHHIVFFSRLKSDCRRPSLNFLVC